MLFALNDEFVPVSSALLLSQFWINFELVAEFEQMYSLHRAATVIGGYKNSNRIQCFVSCNNKMRINHNFQSSKLSSYRVDVYLSSVNMQPLKIA
jgi:hypothetical protein